MERNDRDVYLKLGKLNGLVNEYGERLASIEQKLDRLISDVAKLQGKASVWGSVAGLLAGAFTSLLLRLGLR